MENQHRHIAGYRELTEDEISLINEIKKKGDDLGEFLAGVANTKFSYEVLSMVTVSMDAEKKRTEYREPASPDGRWVAIARTHFQEGLMALVRSVAKPESF